MKPLCFEECKSDIYSLGFVVYEILFGQQDQYIKFDYEETKNKYPDNWLVSDISPLLKIMLEEDFPQIRFSINEFVLELLKIIRNRL